MQPTDEIYMPDFSRWPPHDTFRGRPINQVIQIFLRMDIDAEWRATMLNDLKYSEWFHHNFNLQYLIDYWIISGEIEEETVLKWTTQIREKYDWTKNA